MTISKETLDAINGAVARAQTGDYVRAMPAPGRKDPATPEQAKIIVEALNTSPLAETMALWARLQDDIDVLFQVHEHVEKKTVECAIKINQLNDEELKTLNERISVLKKQIKNAQ